MSTKTYRQMPSFMGVAAGSTATLSLPIGVSYDQLYITYSGVTLAQMTGIRVVANGKPFMRLDSGERLDTLNVFDGRAAADGVIALDFTRFGLRTRAAEELTTLGTGLRSADTKAVEVSTLTVEIDIAAGASAPALSARALQSPPQALGYIKHLRVFNYSPSASGEFEISDIPKGHLFNKVHFASADINSLRIERDRFVVFERNAAENQLIQSDGVRVPQSGIFTYDPTEQGNGGEMLETRGVQDLRFMLEMSAGGSVPVIVESIAPLI